MQGSFAALRMTARSISHSEPPANIPWTLQLVQHGNAVILERYEALARRVEQDCVLGGAVLPGALTGADLDGRTQVSPVQRVRLVPPNRQRLASFACLSLISLGEIWLVGECLPGCD